MYNIDFSEKQPAEKKIKSKGVGQFEELKQRLSVRTQ
jgi:hypothetical protein